MRNKQGKRRGKKINNLRVKNNNKISKVIKNKKKFKKMGKKNKSQLPTDLTAFK
jgi:hypothetical protein